MTAVTKGWLKFHEDTFAILRSQDNDMYVGLERKARPKGSAKTAPKPKDSSKPEKVTPAYHQVVQKMPGGAAPTLVYEYSATAQKDEPKAAAETEGISNERDGTSDWTVMFLDVLQRSPKRYCTLDEMLE